jgi:hypothetical protein
MPGPITGLSPINRDLFFPIRETQTEAIRLRRLIEGRQMLIRRYGIAYGGVTETLQQVRNGNNPAVSQITAEQRAEVEQQLLSARDEVARGFTQVIARAENDANELAPGTFPRGDAPFQSFDLGEWAEKILETLIDILEGLAAIFDAIGWDIAEEAMETAANMLRWLDRYGEEQKWWSPDDD